MGFRTYTSIAREFGLTVPALKKALSAAGYLDGKTPTAKAAQDGLFEMRPLDPQLLPSGFRMPESGSFPVWDRDKVEAVLQAAQLTANKGFGVSCCSSACHQLGKAADAASPLRSGMPEDVGRSLAWCVAEIHNVRVAYMYDGRHAAGVLVERKTAPLVSFLKERTGSEAAREALKRIEAVVAWFATGADRMRIPESDAPTLPEETAPSL